MKKLIAVMMAVLMVLSLTACGSGAKIEDSATETSSSLDASNAIAETPKHIYDDAKENLARVMQNTYILNCRVERVSSNYFISDGFYIYLPVEELAKLNEFDKIAIIGKVSSEANGGVFVISDAEVYRGNVPEVAPRDDEIYSGIIELLGSGNARVILNNGDKVQVYFAESEETSSLQRYSKIKFSSVEKRITENGTALYDAKLISAENN